MKKMHLSLSTILFVFLAEFSSAQTIIRGPYLQSQGPNSIIIRWRTDSLTDSRVYYGSTIGSNTLFADSATPTTEHRVRLNGLTPLTKYFYSVGSATQTLRGNDPLLFFKTAPDSSSHTPVRFWVIGDFGHGSTPQKQVRDSYLQYVAQDNNPADFQLWVGDDAYTDGTDPQYQTNVFDTTNCYGNLFLNMPFVPTPGNHDWNSICNWQGPCNIDPNVQTGPYLNIVDPPIEGELGGVASHLKLFYSFDYGDIHFISLNSELGSTTPAYNWVGVFDNTTTFTSPMINWLRADLAATTKKWKVAFWHQCPYSGQDNFTELSSGQFFTFATRDHFNPNLEQYGVDLVLTGHDHNYQRSYLINGLYDFKAGFTPSMIVNGGNGDDAQGQAYIKYTNGPLAGKGTVYVVEGNSSEGNSYSPITHPVIYWGEACDTCYGSTIIDVNGDRLDEKYLSSRGVVMDHFTILKQAWTGIDEELITNSGFQVYPNPAVDEAEVKYSITRNCFVMMDLLGIDGRVIHSLFSGERQPGDYSDVLKLDKSGVSAGTYLIRLNCNGEVKYRKIVKMN
ncbi:MAG: Metallophosphoesterase [Bacteroidota bacterium]|nr:Metallophosphoesterase [Bacteroidota bacterium]